MRERNEVKVKLPGGKQHNKKKKRNITGKRLI